MDNVVSIHDKVGQFSEAKMSQHSLYGLIDFVSEGMDFISSEELAEALTYRYGKDDALVLLTRLAINLVAGPHEMGHEVFEHVYGGG